MAYLEVYLVPSNYPSGYDGFGTHHDNLGERVAAGDINSIQDAILAIEHAVGLNPSGTYVQRVLPRKWGALADGVHDDTSAIQSAISYAATNGGIVYLDPGTYKITSALVLLGYVKIQGSGPENTVIKVGNGANCDVMVGQNYVTLTGGGTSGGIGEFSLRDFRIDGNSSNNTSGDGIKVYGYGYRFDNIHVTYMAGRGIVTEWSSGAEPSVGTSEAICSGVKVIRCGGNGVEWAGVHDSQLVNWVIAQNNLSGSPSGCGLWLKGSSSAAQITNCHVWGTSHQDGYVIDAPAYLTSCVSDGSSSRGMVVRSNDVQIVTSNIFVFPDQTPSAKGLVIGQAGYAPIAGSNIDIKISDCQGGALDVTHMGAYNRLTVLNYQTAGTVLIGTPSSTNNVDVICNGGVGTNQRYFSDAAWNSFTPSVSGLSAFTLGNGTISGAYRQNGKSVEFRMLLNVGSTTSFGTGAMNLGSVSLPAALATAQAVGLYYHNGTGRAYGLFGQIGPGGQTFTLAHAAGFFQPSTTEPIAAAAGDSVALSGSYEAS